jgi:hypothetical protein
MQPLKRQQLVSVFGAITSVVIATLQIVPAGGFAGALDANTIIQRSVQVVRWDWQVAPRFNYIERDVVDHGTRTYQVTMILGSPYQRLIAINQKPLAASDREKEQQKLNQVIAGRRKESKAQRERRVAAYEKQRERDGRLLEELSKAFIFRVAGEETVSNHLAYVLLATPKPDYRPADKETKVLTGMRGKLWIDKATFQWVKVEAEVIHPVSIEGFLARVEPGTRFELDRAPVAEYIWLPTHFSVRSKARILSIIGYQTYTDESYSGYQKADSRVDTIVDGRAPNK